MDAGQLSIRGAADDDDAAKIGAVGIFESEAHDRDQPAAKAIGGIGGRPHEHVGNRHRRRPARRQRRKSTAGRLASPPLLA